MNRYDEILNLLQAKIKTGSNKSELETEYNYYLEEGARHYRKADPYYLSKILLQRKPKDSEAFGYVFTSAISKGLYEDALDAINIAKKANGETKEILSKELYLYERMNAQARAEQAITHLYQLYPDDSDIRYKYTNLRLQQAKSYMAENIYSKALPHWLFVEENGDPDIKKIAIVSKHNCYDQLGDYKNALLALDQLIQLEPNEPGWHSKKAIIYGKQKEYIKALDEYKKELRITDPLGYGRAMNGYDELAAEYTKQLIEDYLFDEAIALVNHWLTDNPKSNQAIKYGFSISAQMKDYEGMEKYALMGMETIPNDLFYQMKLVEVYNQKKGYSQSLEMLKPLLDKQPYHKELIAAYTETVEKYARILIKKSKSEECVAVVDNALEYDSSNTTLKYFKGIVYEKMHQMDSAYYYQSFYEPSLTELKEYETHMKYLKNRSFKNDVGIHYQYFRFSDTDILTSITTVEYTRFGKENTYTGRFNYSGRDNGKGLQGIFEWSRTWNPLFYTRIDAGVGGKCFPQAMISGSAYKSLKNDWEIEAGAGYKKLVQSENMFNLVGGVSKEYESFRLNARINGILIDSDWYYNLSMQARFFIHNQRNYILLMGSAGSAPDIEIIDNQLYSAFSATNTMAAVGGQHLISNTFSAGLLCSWYNYKEQIGKYRNMYNIQLMLNVKF